MPSKTTCLNYQVIVGVAKTVNGFSYKRLDVKTVEDGLKPKGDKKMLLGKPRAQLILS